MRFAPIIRYSLISLATALALGDAGMASAQAAVPGHRSRRTSRGNHGYCPKNEREFAGYADLDHRRVSGAQLEQRGITEISKIEDFTPNLTFKNVPSNSGVASNAAIYIRGIGQNEFAPSVDPGVGIYVDGVYMGRSVGGIFDAIDMASVEVLRGPQGTLFGRNTIGGAVNITSAQPTDYWTGRADMKFGTGGRANARGVVSGPITDNLSFKLAGGIFSQDGYVNAPYQGHKLGNQDTKSIKGALRWKPSSRLEITLAGDYMRDDSYGPPVVVTGINQSAYASGSSLVFLNNLLAGGMNPGTCLSASSIANTACFNSRTFSNTTNYGTDPDYSHIRTGGVALTATYRFSEAAVLKSVSSWREIDGNFAQDRDGSNLGINYVHNLYKQQQFTQELQLSGKPASNLKYAAGLYFFTEWGHDLNPIQFLVLSENSGGNFNYKSWAAYGQATWTVVPGLDLTGGVRYTRDYKDFTTAQLVTRVLLAPLGAGGALVDVSGTNGVGTYVVPVGTYTNNSARATPMVNLAYHVTKSLMGYATFSQGFKGGGFTQRLAAVFTTLPTFKPETVDSYELGFKYTVPGNWLRLNGDIYQANYKNKQVVLSDPAVGGLAPTYVNIPRSRIRGSNSKPIWRRGPVFVLMGRWV
jgi:iron complex outermembrane receptor protein